MPTNVMILLTLVLPRLSWWTSFIAIVLGKVELCCHLRWILIRFLRKSNQGLWTTIVCHETTVNWKQKTPICLKTNTSSFSWTIWFSTKLYNYLLDICNGQWNTTASSSWKSIDFTNLCRMSSLDIWRPKNIGEEILQIPQNLSTWMFDLLIWFHIISSIFLIDDRARSLAKSLNILNERWLDAFGRKFRENSWREKLLDTNFMFGSKISKWMATIERLMMFVGNTISLAACVWCCEWVTTCWAMHCAKSKK